MVQSGRESNHRAAPALALLLCALLTLMAVLPFGTQNEASANELFEQYLPVLVDQSTKFNDGVDTLTVGNGFVRVVVDKKWGGAIREIWFAGENLVNNFDGGRLIGVSLYDDQTVPPSGDISDPNWGWNPTPSDIYDHENRPLAYNFADGTLYVKARNLHWNPNNKGGGPAQAVASDIIVETWVNLPSVAPNGIHVKYRITYDGLDPHSRVPQELGFVYVQPSFRRFVRYVGDAPWTNAAVTIDEAPPVWPEAHAISTVNENWGGFVNGDDFGLILWAPQSFPRFTYIYHENPTPFENSTTYMNPWTFADHNPGTVYDFEQYLFAGKWQTAREQIYLLRQELGRIPDVFPGFGYVDLPANNASVSGLVEVAGWTFDDRGINQVEIVLDGQVVGEAQYGLPRADVENDYPGFPGVPDVGYQFWLNTSSYENGSHILQVRSIDTSANSTFLEPGAVTISIAN